MAVSVTAVAATAAPQRRVAVAAGMVTVLKTSHEAAAAVASRQKSRILSPLLLSPLLLSPLLLSPLPPARELAGWKLAFGSPPGVPDGVGDEPASAASFGGRSGRRVSVCSAEGTDQLLPTSDDMTATNLEPRCRTVSLGPFARLFLCNPVQRVGLWGMEDWARRSQSGCSCTYLLATRRGSFPVTLSEGNPENLIRDVVPVPAPKRAKRHFPSAAQYHEGV